MSTRYVDKNYRDPQFWNAKTDENGELSGYVYTNPYSNIQTNKSVKDYAIHMGLRNGGAGSQKA